MDLSDADPEIDCKLGIDLYIAHWAAPDALRADVRERLGASSCDLLDMAQGDLIVGGAVVGFGGGCADQPSVVFAITAANLEVAVYADIFGFAGIQTWFVQNRIGLPATGVVSGGAVDPPIGQQSVEQLIDKASTIAYKTLLRHPEDYRDSLLYYRAEVLQVVPGGALVLVTRASSGSWSDVVWLTYSSADPLLADDIIEFVGRGAGTYSYQTVLGTKDTVPAVDAINMRFVP
ncbi:MAG: hypothetical protein EPO00_10955 [Chloroflexota bacterium]|nr:MAG: hypothetical protein EPO00_10955 [Chloroflexota bacterium]